MERPPSVRHRCSSPPHRGWRSRPLAQQRRAVVAPARRADRRAVRSAPCCRPCPRTGRPQCGSEGSPRRSLGSHPPGNRQPHNCGDHPPRSRTKKRPRPRQRNRFQSIQVRTTAADGTAELETAAWPLPEWPAPPRLRRTGATRRYGRRPMTRPREPGQWPPGHSRSLVGEDTGPV